MTGEGSSFPSLKIQDIMKLRRAIERDDQDEVCKLIESHPRYLVSSGETPTILQVFYLPTFGTCKLWQAYIIYFGYISFDFSFF